jgi:trehalose 6-phosphate synthase
MFTDGESANGTPRAEEPPLFVVSNREPYRRDDGDAGWKRTTGGLVSAVDPLVRRSGGTWIAWNPGAEGDVSRTTVPGREPFTLLRVPVSHEEVELY